MSTSGTGPAPKAVGTRLSVMMFIQFFVWGAWYVTVGNYMAAQGMGSAIAWAYTVGPIAAIVSPFFLGMIADRFFASERVLGTLHILGGLALILAPNVVSGENPSATPFILLLLVHMLCYMPTLGLTNTVAFHTMTNSEKQFPVVRVFGTIGWIAAGLLIGFTAKRMLAADVDRNDADAVNAAIAALPHFFYFAGGAGLMLGLYSFTLPHTPPPAKGKAITASEILGLGALGKLSSPSFWVFIASSLLICIPLAAYYAFAPVFLTAAGIAPDQVPVTMSYGQMSEIFFMLIMPLCFARLGVKWMLAIGMLAWVLRYGLFAAGAPTQIEWMLVTGVLLHGICYDFFFVTGFIYTDKKSTAEIRGQAQGFLVLVTQGIGMLAGAQISGLLFNSMVKGEGAELLKNWQQFWIIPCVAAGVIMLAFIALFKDDTKGNVSGGAVAEAAAKEDLV